MTENDKIQRAQAWEHLVLSAKQRLAVLNFYFLIASALAGSQFVLMEKEQTLNALGVLGWLLSVLSLIFWQWDKRSASFVKNSEETLIYYESNIKNKYDIKEDKAFLFIRENQDTEKKKAQNFWSLPYLTFTRSLRYLYLTFSIVGLGGVVLVIWQRWEDIKMIGWIPITIGFTVGLIVLLFQICQEMPERSWSLKCCCTLLLILFIIILIGITILKKEFVSEYWYAVLAVECLIPLLVYMWNIIKKRSGFVHK